MKDINPVFWKILVVLISLVAVGKFIQWLWQQWWFVPLLVLIGAICVIAIMVWVRRRQESIRGRYRM